MASEESQIRRRRRLKLLSRSRLAAEEKQGEKEHAEIDLLMRAADKGLTYTALDPQSALQLAQAARAVVQAEYETADLRVKECELLLETLRDTAEQTLSTWRDASDQVGTILAFFSRQCIHVDLFHPPHSPPRSPLLDSELSFSSPHSVADSDTDFDESSSEV